MKKGEMMIEEQKKKISNSLKGHLVLEKTREKISKAQKGRHPKTEFKKGHLAPKTAFKKGHIPWNTGKRFLQVSGKRNPNWKGGISKLNRLLRNYPEYRKWFTKVFQRDNWICRNCGARSQIGQSICLVAHHIKPFAQIIKEEKIKTVKQALQYKELWNVDNGITLCSSCHKIIHLKNYEERI